MASGDPANLPKHMTFGKSNLPLFGALLDYVETSLKCLIRRSYSHAETLNAKSSNSSLSPTFLACTCLLVGLACNVKFEVATYNDVPLTNDLHYVLLSDEDNLYIDDIDVSRVVWCIEASDVIVLTISFLLIWNSYRARSPTSEYLFLPWIGASLRGLCCRQAPTVSALLYTLAVVDGKLNVLFVTAITFLFLLEARIWLEVVRLMVSRWQRRNDVTAADSSRDVETLWSSEEVQSVEVQNYIY